MSVLNSDSDSESEENFYTPPSSPGLLDSDSDSDASDEFNDTVLPSHEVFLEGDFPTKTDCTVFNALRYADCELDKKKYPNIYRWHHCVNLYCEGERESWTNPNPDRSCTYESRTGTSTPSKPSWLRVTGINSPRSTFKTYTPH